MRGCVGSRRRLSALTTWVRRGEPSAPVAARKGDYAALNWYGEQGLGAATELTYTDNRGQKADYTDTPPKVGLMSAKLKLLHEDVTKRIIRAFFDVYNELGYGFLESVYQKAMPFALKDVGLECTSEVPLPVMYRGHLVGEYRADLIVVGKIIVETKASASIQPIHELQLFNYLKAARFEVGMILNFGPQAKFQRYVFSNRSEQSV